MTPEELKQYALLKLRMQRENTEKPKIKRMSRRQIEQTARDAVKMGGVNEEGYIVNPE